MSIRGGNRKFCDIVSWGVYLGVDLYFVSVDSIGFGCQTFYGDETLLFVDRGKDEKYLPGGKSCFEVLERQTWAVIR